MVPKPTETPSTRTLCADAKSGVTSATKSIRLCGRLLTVEPATNTLVLADASGHLRLKTSDVAVAAGDIVEIEARPFPELTVKRLRVLTPYRRDVPFPSPGADYFRLNQGCPTRVELLRKRAQLLRAVRRFFDQRGYIEVQTPLRVRCPGLEPHLCPEPAGEGYLITSPEYQMKRLLSAGMERIYFLGPCWRSDESGPLHLNEFTMLEWYHAYCSLEELLVQTEQLICAVTRDLTGSCQLPPAVTGLAPASAGPAPANAVDLTDPFVRLTVAEACRHFAGVELETLRDAADYDIELSRLLVDHVEPQLEHFGAVFLCEYPAQVAALAQRHPQRPWVAERAELYIHGIELANAFGELTDPDEQLQRLQQDNRIRRERGAPEYDIDQRFIEALREGLPPSAGIALGFDRLLMLLCGERQIDRVVAFGRAST